MSNAATLKQNLLLLGGLFGFLCCFATGLVVGLDVVQVLLNSAIGCVVVGLMFKWVAVLLIEYATLQRKKAMAAAAAVAEAEAAKKPKKGAAK